MPITNSLFETSLWQMRSFDQDVQKATTKVKSSKQGQKRQGWNVNFFHSPCRWGFDCKNMGASKDKFGCKWYSGIDDGWHKEKQWINKFKEDFKIQCPNHGIVAGFKSIHDNKYEDRIWNVYCCTVSQWWSYQISSFGGCGLWLKKSLKARSKPRKNCQTGLTKNKIRSQKKQIGTSSRPFCLP